MGEKMNQISMQEKGFAFGQAVTIAAKSLIEHNNQSFIESIEGKEKFQTNIKALYYAILEARQQIREEEDKL